MDAPRIEVCYFGADPQAQWLRMTRVLSFGASRHCPEWELRVAHITPEPLVSALGIESHVQNTQKMERWFQVVSEAPDGARLLLLDADTMILRSLDDVWDRGFDFAYTTKPTRGPLNRNGFPFNSGVVFVRVTDRTRAFVSAWRDANRRMLGDREHHQVWRARYGGINQASLGCMLEQGALFGLAAHQLPCLEWNCEDSSWEQFSPATTRIVHLKSALRRGLFSRSHVPRHVLPLVALWRGLERDAMTAEARDIRKAKLSGRTPTAAPAPAAPAQTIPAPTLSVGFHRYQPRSGRPRLHPTGSVHTSVRLPVPLYDAYCRKAFQAKHRSVNRVIRETLEAAIPDQK